jgi:DNA-binding XRE family transcriptional regulator
MLKTKDHAAPRATPPPSTTVAGEGADINDMPPELQTAIRRGLFGRGQKWGMLSALLTAEPGRLIAVARELRGWSQQKLAEVTGLRQPEISQAENQFKQAKIGTVMLIAAALELPISVLIADSDRADTAEPLSPSYARRK